MSQPGRSSPLFGSALAERRYNRLAERRYNRLAERRYNQSAATMRFGCVGVDFYFATRSRAQP